MTYMPSVSRSAGPPARLKVAGFSVRARISDPALLLRQALECGTLTGYGQGGGVERITIDLADDMTLGALRSLADGMGKTLVISFEDATARRAPGARRGRPPGRKAKNGRRRRRRKLSPEARAKLVENLKKARAVRAANRKVTKKKARGRKRTKAEATPPAASAA